MSTPYSPYDPGEQQAGLPGAYPQQGGYAPYPPQQGGYAPGAPGGSRGYLQGGPVGFGDAVKLAFRNTFTYQAARRGPPTGGLRCSPSSSSLWRPSS